ncbi:MAG: amino acid ABC transporter permease [Proteobacteria bacterium]|nr:amino acid ABC transporter permease [Pseudomonadota bacterium]MBI3498315.1 amino acid ABC transporter permease [Pseudomonadota bacterium]
MGYQYDFGVVLKSAWFEAVLMTLTYAVGTVVGGLLIGVLCGVALLLPYRWITIPINVYVQFFRCTPLLIQIVWFFYALPIVINFNLPAWAAAGLGLTLYMGSFCAEIFRAGVMSIDKGQWQAARALGMTYLQLMRRIILPQATRRMVPPFVNQSVLQLKNTSLLYVVAVPDIMYVSSQITSSTYRPLEVYTFAAILYFLLLYPMTQLARRLETRVDG